MFKAIVLSLPLVLLTKVFGFYDWFDLPQVNVPGLGSFWLVDVVFFVLVASVIASRRRANGGTLFYLVATLIVYIAFQAVRNFLFEGYPMRLLLNGLRGVVYYFYFFVVICLIRDRGELYKLLIVCCGVAIVSAVTTVLSYFKIIETPAQLTLQLNIAGHMDVPVIYPAAEYLFDATFFVLLSWSSAKQLSPKYKKLAAAGAILIAMAVFVSLARSSILVLVLGFMSILLVMHKFRFHKLILPFLMTMLIIVSLSFFMTAAFGSGWDALMAKMIQGYQDTMEGSSSLNQRLGILEMKWKETTDDNPIFGRGFNWGPLGADLNPDLNPLARSNHSGLASIYVVFGGIGFLIFGVIFFDVMRKLQKIYQNSLRASDRQIALGILFFHAAMMLKSVVTDAFTDGAGVIVYAMVWAMVAKLHQFQFSRGKGLPLEPSDPKPQNAAVHA
jgi:hypothetical protein